MERAGTPSVTICTHLFEHTSKAMASMWGAADYPVIYTQHPIAPLTREQLRARAEEIIPRIESILTGEERAEPMVAAGARLQEF